MMKTNEGQANENKKAAEKKSTLTGVVCTPAGNSIAPVYKRVFDDKLNRNVVKKVDTTNITEFIQASKSSTDLAALQKRFIALGEIPNVDPNSQFGVDQTILPSDIHQLYQMVNDINSNYNKLPESVQKVFGNAKAYGDAILNGTAGTMLANAFAQKPEEKKEEVKDNE